MSKEIRGGAPQYKVLNDFPAYWFNWHSGEYQRWEPGDYEKPEVYMISDVERFVYQISEQWDQNQKDAERYRALRSGESLGDEEPWVAYGAWYDPMSYEPEELDSAVDKMILRIKEGR